ncbi:MAG TPA: hypothetical protein IAB96_06965 [Candidatus Coprenecus pullicola]|nr:hypothetical protein [Candidatus Coprenecus pullicola]
MGLELKLKAVLVSVAAAACVSCTSELKVGEDNMDLTITVGGDSLMLPLGSTESMGISDFLDLDSVDFLYVDEYGNYYLEMTDTFEEEVAVSDFAESMTVEGIDRNFDDRDFTVYSDATGIGADFDFEEEFTYLFSFQDANDSGLVSISYVNLENTYLLPRVHLEADKTIPESMVVSLEVIVPEKYVFEDVPAVNGTTVTFEGNVSSSGDVNFQPVMMESIELNLGENDPFEFEDVFTVNNLSISVDQAEMTEFEGAVLSVSSGVTFGGDDGMLHPSSFYGKVDIRLDEIEEQILLDEIPEYLKGEEVKLDFISPYATVSLMTNSGVPIIIDADIVPVFESGDSLTKPIGLSLSAPVSDDETVTETANYWLASETPSELPSGYQWEEADVRNLLSWIPDRLDISVRPYSNVDSEEDHFIDCNASYNFSGEIGFVLPFSFGDGLYVPVRDTLDNMPEEIGTALTNADIMLNGTVHSSFPVALQLSGDFLNGNYEPLGIKIPMQTIGAGGTDGEPVSSQLSIKVPQSPRAEEIAYLVFQFELLNGTGASISESSTIQITDISAGIPGGLTLDLNQE